jgi:DNA-binding CsgD family transcriptional regulator
MWPIDRPPQWVDRSQELAALRAGVEALRHGGGTAVWVEGEPGIGKSSLVAEALAGTSQLEWDVGWGIADQLAERLPLSVMQDCLQVRLSSPDPRRAHAAGLLRSQRLGLFTDGDASVSGVEVLTALADELCAAAPTVMVIDDLQWADDASLLVWHQLAASIDQLRLLLIATSRSDPRRPEVQQVRASLARRGGAVVTLGPLPESDVAALVTALLGTPPDHTRLRQLTAQAAGNPLYLRELVDALARPGQEQLPASLAAVLSDRLSSVSAETAQILRTAALPRQDGEMTLTHQWLPDLVRLAIATGDRQVARTAAWACQQEAAAETRPARAAAASQRCHGLLESDPVPLRDVVAHYRTVGPGVELPAALEDLAAVLAERGQESEARATLDEAVSLYEGLNARWDIRRANGRLRPYGIRRGVRGPRRPRAASGWEALTPTEVKIAALVARGDSTSEIARGMFLSRRTVQTYISHILAKLGAKGRVDIVREALRHGVSP